MDKTKNTFTKGTLSAAILIGVLPLIMAGCSNADSATPKTPPDTTINRPAPDNNSATNSSLADSSYSKDSTGKIPDTTHR